MSIMQSFVKGKWYDTKLGKDDKDKKRKEKLPLI